MIFNIAKKIDIELLNNKIEEFISNKTRQHPLHDCEPYIFMSPETLRDMPTLDEYYLSSEETKSNRRIGTYHGCKVFIDQSMKYGEVELR